MANKITAIQRLRGAADSKSPTWRAFMAYFEERKAECGADLLRRGNTHEDDCFYRGKANAFTELMSLDKEAGV